VATVGRFSRLFAAFTYANSLIILAPEVGLEPTTLRLTTSESVDLPAATDCYNHLSINHLDPNSFRRTTTQTCPIMIDFDGAWAQKWAQSIPSPCPALLAKLDGGIFAGGMDVSEAQRLKAVEDENLQCPGFFVPVLM
jgi:hypothetical protein